MPRSAKLGSNKVRKNVQVNLDDIIKLEKSCYGKINKIRNNPSLGIEKVKAACIPVGKHGFGMAVGPFILPSGEGYIICARSANSDFLYSWAARAEELLTEVNEIRSKIQAFKSSIDHAL